jgi:hypothetical protein
MYAHAITFPILHGARRGPGRSRPLFLRRSTQHLHGARVTVRARRGAAGVSPLRPRTDRAVSERAGVWRPCRVRPSWLRETRRVGLAVANVLAWSALLYLAAS